MYNVYLHKYICINVPCEKALDTHKQTYILAMQPRWRFDNGNFSAPRKKQLRAIKQTSVEPSCRGQHPSEMTGIAY